MSRFVSTVQFQVKKSSSDLTTYIFRVLTGGWLGMVFAHILQTMIGFSNLLFLFVIVLVTGCIVRMTKNWGFFSVMILNLFCVLVGILLNMYIMVAPGA